LAGASALSLVVSVDSGKLVLDGQSQRTVVLAIDATHTFDTTFSTAASQTFKLSTTADGTHGGGAIYTAGVTYGASSVTIATDSSTATTLYYYSVETAAMGGRILIDAAGVGIVDGSTGGEADVYYIEVRNHLPSFVCGLGLGLGSG
jgi:hypothetical protein